MLGMHPDVQNRVYEEVLTVLGPERTPDYQDLPSLKYTELVLKETLRLFPPSPCLERLVLDDLPLDGGTVSLNHSVLNCFFRRYNASKGFGGYAGGTPCPSKYRILAGPSQIRPG